METLLYIFNFRNSIYFIGKSAHRVLANSKNKISLFIKTYYNFPHVKNIYDDIFYFYIFIIFYYNAK